MDILNLVSVIIALEFYINRVPHKLFQLAYVNHQMIFQNSDIFLNIVLLIYKSNHLSSSSCD